jgi:transposase InsO family protein
MGLKLKKTRPYSPRTNGKAERLIKILLEEWAYVIRHLGRQERPVDDLPADL